MDRWGYRGHDERRFVDRARDEVRSWFGDEAAWRRRQQDYRDADRYREIRRYDERGSTADDERRRSERDWRDERERREDRDSRAEWRDDRDWHAPGPEAAWRRESGWLGFGDRGGESRERGDFPESREREFRPERERESYPARESRSIYGPWSWSYSEAWFVPGPHSGRGPRGYQRSDDRIKEDVCERLCHHGAVDATDIEVSVANGEVTLRGTVPSRDAKRMAEGVCDTVAGVRDVHNELRFSQGETSVPDQSRETPQRPRAA
jgi:hypothetical protein